jgi:hypothetical protein
LNDPVLRTFYVLPTGCIVSADNLCDHLIVHCCRN